VGGPSCPGSAVGAAGAAAAGRWGTAGAGGAVGAGGAAGGAAAVGGTGVGATGAGGGAGRAGGSTAGAGGATCAGGAGAAGRGGAGGGAAGRGGATGAAGFTTGGTGGAGGAGGRGGAAGGFVCWLIAFSTSPGREIFDRSILVLISGSAKCDERDSLALAASCCPAKCLRTRSASSTSIELECVFFSVTPTFGRTSRISRLLTSSSRARSLIRIFIRLVFSLRSSVPVTRS